MDYYEGVLSWVLWIFRLFLGLEILKGEFQDIVFFFFLVLK